MIRFILVKFASTTDIHHKLMEVYGDGIMEYSMLENGKMSLKMVQHTYMMVNKHAGQHNKDGCEHSMSRGIDFRKLVSHNLIFVYCTGVAH